MSDPTAADRQTIAGFLEGDRQAIALVNGWIACAAGPFRRRLGADWEDLLQEVRLEVLRLLQKGVYRGEARLKTYLWRTVCNTCLDALRRRRRQPPMDVAGPEDPLPSSDPSPLQRVLEQEGLDRALGALQQMTVECRRLWDLILEGQSYREIGQKLGVSEGALRVRAHRCRKHVVQILDGNSVGAPAPKG
jgi:RNA polymerase sigma-70 factor, ECF subfamily